MGFDSNDNDDEKLVGFFYSDDSYEILGERICYFSDKKGNKIGVYIKESCGNSPHIHLRDNKELICRIKLRTNEYQRDAYEKKNPRRLTKSEERAFNQYMHAIADDANYNNWYKISIEWNDRWRDANPGKTSGVVDLSKGCPDYSHIREPE